METAPTLPSRTIFNGSSKTEAMRNEGQLSAMTEQERPTKDRVGWLRLFGDPCLCWQGQPYPLSRRQPQALLYYLALQGRPTTRQTLCQLFWPEAPALSSQRRLTHVLDDLKRSLPTPALLEITKETIALNAALVSTDTAAFTELTAPNATTAALAQATALYAAPLLTGFGLPKQPTFEVWLLGERMLWDQRYLATLARLVAQQRSERRHYDAVRTALRYLYSNGADEPMHRTLIELYGDLGDQDAVRRQYRWCVMVLSRELGTQPTPVTEAAYTAALRKRYYT